MTDIQGRDGQVHDFRTDLVRRLIDRSRGPVLVHDRVRIRYANPAARSLFGLGEADSPPRRLDEVIVWENGLDRVTARGEGGPAWFHAHHVPLLLGHSWRVATFLESPDDVTVPVDRLAALERSQQASVLAAGLAHELANPVMPLLVSLEAIAGGLEGLCARAGADPLPDPLLESLRESVETAQAAATSLASVLRDYQRFLRPGLPDRDGELCDPRQAVERAVRMAGPRVRGVATLAVDLATAPAVRAPAGFLTQIALNLINNAADALDAQAGDEGRQPPGRGRQPPGRGRIEVRLRSGEGRVELEVRDDGPGISPPVAARLFEPQVTTKAQPTSLGMGLAICRALVKRCGGEISASSTPGQGTSFQVTLPASSPR